jgi:hypothetical protein
MADVRKQAVSLRVSIGDLRRLKKLAQRLGVRDSDVIRFALKTMLARLGPLCDHNVRGRALVPVLLEAGGDLFRYFDLDNARLAEIVNEGATQDQEVESNDLHHIAIAAGVQQSYATLGLGKVTTGKTGERDVPPTPEPSVTGHLRSYLYSKYVDIDLNSEPARTK